MPTNENDNAPRKGSQLALIPGAQAVAEDHPATVERRAFVDGLFNELNAQLFRYVQVVAQLAEAQGRMVIAERNLRLTREHLKIILSRTDEDVPPDWQNVLRKVRFVGARLGDAVVQVLQEHGSLTTQEMLDKLNAGQFRFRTTSPRREINAAMLRNSKVRREDDCWIYDGPAAEATGKEAV